MKKIAIDRACFESIITLNYLYVDKTKFLYDIVVSNVYYFLSRPHRFGKSLTISTLKAIFEGKKELFNDLYIKKSDWNWSIYPIIHLDFNIIPSENRKEMEIFIFEELLDIAKKYDIITSKTQASTLFYEVVQKIYEKTKKTVVILVDEYDKPIINHLGKREEELQIAKDNRDFMKKFYDNLKPLEPYLKTVFITGVSKFSKVSIFSSLNNLIEIDSDKRYAEMLGYTEKELNFYFGEHLKKMANNLGINDVEELKLKFKIMYNGFRFTNKDIKVYNPFSVGKALEANELKNYWFVSGTPTFLTKLIEAKKYYLSIKKEALISEDEIGAYDIENLNITTLLYQTGYLTIKKYKVGERFTEILLDFPNTEVRDGFCTHLLQTYSNANFSQNLILNILQSIKNKDFVKFIEILQSIFASLPYTLSPSPKIIDFELYYHNIFYIIVLLVADVSFKVSIEILTVQGRIDAVIETYDLVYIIEFKCNQNAKTAINQIRVKKYDEKYRGKNKKIELVGINFTSNKKNIADWVKEECF